MDADNVVDSQSGERPLYVEVLAIPGCPGAALLEERLTEAIQGRRDILLSIRVITDHEEAAASGMRGSPTILVNGRDPFPGSGQAGSTSCRIYLHEDGLTDGAPSVHQLLQHLTC